MNLIAARTLCEGASTYKSHGRMHYAMGTWRRAASHVLRSPRLTLKAGRKEGRKEGLRVRA